MKTYTITLKHEDNQTVEADSFSQCAGFINFYDEAGRAVACIQACEVFSVTSK